jgi:hypothetical protein
MAMSPKLSKKGRVTMKPLKEGWIITHQNPIEIFAKSAAIITSTKANIKNNMLL